MRSLVGIVLQINSLQTPIDVKLTFGTICNGPFETLQRDIGLSPSLSLCSRNTRSPTRRRGAGLRSPIHRCFNRFLVLLLFFICVESVLVGRSCLFGLDGQFAFAFATTFRRSGLFVQFQ